MEVSSSFFQQEEVIESNDYVHIIKGKRTKRQRLLFPSQATITSSSSGGRDDQTSLSPTTSTDVSQSLDDDEDMANCLILLAQGRGLEKMKQEQGHEKGNLYVYECKTCKRCFSSFQALGGHRASHKKPQKGLSDEKKNNEDLENRKNNKISPVPEPVPMVPSQKDGVIHSQKLRAHECSICGAEFSSGQALGGHMRRHRAVISEVQEMKKQKNNLFLDLNLPAPEEEHDFPKSFTSKQLPLVFVTSSLVDCHY